ncbi:MAG: glycine C-acetyltransferase, partial [Bacteroidales bacterium]
MYTNFKDFLQKELTAIEEAGLYKKERVIVTPQQASIKISSGEEVLNFCANNYLGLSNSRVLVDAAKEALDNRGFGMSSVRF